MYIQSFALYIFGFVFNIWPFLFDLTSLLLYNFGFVFNIWPFLLYIIRFYSIFYDLYSISVYFYCIIFVYIVYSVICTVYFGFVFNIWLFLFDLTSLLLYIFGFVFNIWPFLLYIIRFYSIFYDLYSISVYFLLFSLILYIQSFALYIFGFVFNIWSFLFDLTSLFLYSFGFVLYNSGLLSIYFDICF